MKLKKTFLKILIFFPIKVFKVLYKNKKFREWFDSKLPTPPPSTIKRMIVSEYQQKYQYTTLVETGTYLGDMVKSQKNIFKKIISIELSTDLYENAKKRFRKDKNVTIVQGDSSKVLPKILSDINEPVIFWLDAHHSGGITAKRDKDCPILKEIDAIFNNNKHDHVLLIDDARCFIGEHNYPTIEELTKHIKSINNKYQVEVKLDVIRCTV